MLKKNRKILSQENLFKSRLESIINVEHEYCKLSKLIDWEGLEEDLSIYYCLDNGRPGHDIRRMGGLLFIQEKEGIVDEKLIKDWLENPYWQYFCGEEYFQHDFPLDPSSLSHFRSRIGEEGMERLLEETIKVGLKSGVIKKKDLERITFDSTVQEKAVKYPTDTMLYYKSINILVKKAKELGIELRQSYVRVSKEALFKANKYGVAKQMNRSKKHKKKLKTYLGRLIRDIERKTVNNMEQQIFLMEELRKANKIYNQQRSDKNKIYSFHAEEVECIAKGKVDKKYEFGCKAGYGVTNKSNFIVGAKAFHGNPYDGHTLKAHIEQTERLTGVAIKRGYVDLGYRGHGIERKDLEIIHPRTKQNMTQQKRKERKRRNAIEPIIGHLKNDLARGSKNRLKGIIGDKINAIRIAIGYNLRKILKKFLHIIFFIQILSKFKKLKLAF